MDLKALDGQVFYFLVCLPVLTKGARCPEVVGPGSSRQRGWTKGDKRAASAKSDPRAAEGIAGDPDRTWAHLPPHLLSLSFPVRRWCVGRREGSVV